jgi:hypothetical protein
VDTGFAVLAFTVPITGVTLHEVGRRIVGVVRIMYLDDILSLGDTVGVYDTECVFEIHLSTLEFI